MAIRDVVWSEPVLERLPDPELESIARQGGRVQGAAHYFSPVPWIYLGLSRLNQRLMKRVALDHDLGDLAGLVVSQDNSCRYCYAVQRALLQSVGFDAERIARLEETFLLAEIGPRERAALDFARRVSRSNPLVRRAELQALHDAGFGQEEVRELALLVGLNLLFNRISTLSALPPERWEALPDRWQTRLLRPLLGLLVRHGVRRRDAPAWLPDEQKSGPFAYLTNALDGHPGAGELRQILDEMWKPTALSPRAVALCFAVVARALGCPLSEPEAAALASQHGLSPEELEAVLANLASPALDPTEALLVPFARQTVWYQVPDLQRRSRELRDALDSQAFLEALMVVSLANVVCRLGFLAEAG